MFTHLCNRVQFQYVISSENLSRYCLMTLILRACFFMWSVLVRVKNISMGKGGEPLGSR